jgi:hypothetical protein
MDVAPASPPKRQAALPPLRCRHHPHHGGYLAVETGRDERGPRRNLVDTVGAARCFARCAASALVPEDIVDRRGQDGRVERSSSDQARVSVPIPMWA